MNRIQFDDFEIDLDMFELYRGGKPIEIGAKPLDLLICLIENRDRVVSREFLRMELWGGAALSPAAIPTCALAVRRALSDSAEKPRYLKSHRSRGYRFIGEIRRIGRAKTSSKQGQQMLPLVGRAPEMSLLRAASRDTASQKRGRIVYLTGEAGIGKTRLLAEFSKGAEAEFSILRAKAAPIDGAPSFWPWIQILNEVQASDFIDSAEVADQIRRLSRTFPEIARADYRRYRSDEKTHRHNVFLQWANVIRSIAALGPTVLTVDDAHLMDQESLTLLYWLADEIESAPLLMIITTRPLSPLTPAAALLSDIASLPHTDKRVLKPLSRADISSLLDPLAEDNDALSEILTQRTGGNAFYVSHLLHCLDEIVEVSDRTQDDSGAPLNAREIVSRQLSDLPSDTRDALAASSILGQRFPASALSALADVHQEDLAAQLEPALDAWILREEVNHLEFNHSILRESLYQTLAPSSRRRLHLRAADYLKTNNEFDARASEIALHLSKALPLASSVDAFDYCIRAARRATKRFSYSQAREFYNVANSIQSSDVDAPLSSRCDLLIEMSQSVLFTGDRDESRKLIAEAAQIARTTSASSRLARCALSIAPDYLTIEVGSHDTTLIRLLREALSLENDANSAMRAVLLGRLCQAVQWSETQATRGAIADESLAVARRSENPDAILAGLTAKAESLHGPNQANERLAILRQLERTAPYSLPAPAQLLLHTRLIATHLEMGNFSKIEIENERHKELANEIGLPQFQWYSIATDSMLAAARGDINRASELAGTYSAVAGPDADYNYQQTFACQFSLRNIELDNTGQHIEVYREYAESQRLVKSWKAAYSWALHECGQFDNARSVLDSFQASDLDQLENEAGGGIGLAVLSEVAASVGSPEQRVDLLSRVLPATECFASAGYGVAYFGSFARYAGLLCVSIGQIERGIDLLRHAASQERKNGTPSWLAYSLLDLLKAEQGAGADQSQTRRSLHEFVDIGIKPDLARVKRKLRSAGFTE